MNFIILTLLFLYSCNLKLAGNKTTDDVFPEKRPSDFTIVYSENGGMLDISETMFISKDSCYYEKNKYRNIVRVDFRLSDAALDSIYDEVVKNKFNEIETYSKKVYDRGGNSISVSFGDTNFRVSNSGFSFIEKDWTEEYKSVMETVSRYAESEWEKKSSEFLITIENSVNDRVGYIMFDNFKVFDGENPRFNKLGEFTNRLRLAQGVYSMNYKYLNDYKLDSINISDKIGMRIFSKSGRLEWTLY
ncbi:MAG: hypothetical protein ABI462_14755 [Ignavibacteria bacterium]